MTPPEFEQLKDYDLKADFLVIESLESKQGKYEQVGSIQARRLAAFLASCLWGLSDCIYLDDNISAVAGVASWEETLACLQKNKVENHALMSGFFISCQYVSSQDYLWKLFYMDFSEITSLLDLRTSNDIFFLGFSPQFAMQSTEDYLFQMCIDSALKKKQLQGLYPLLRLNSVVPMQTAALVRSQLDAGAAKSTTLPFQNLKSIKEDSEMPSWAKEGLNQLQQQVNYNEVLNLRMRNNYIHRRDISKIVTQNHYLGACQGK